MLKKLLKKDFQATARSFLPLILGFVVTSILAKILFEVGIMSPILNGKSYVSDTNEFMVIFSIIFLALYIIYVIAFYILTYVFIVSDFYKTMVSEQGYLTHTLPVKSSTLINSKLIVAIFWQIITGFLVLLSFLFFIIGHMPEIPWQELVHDFTSSLGMSFKDYMIFMVVCLIIGLFSSPLMFYASIALGHLFGKHKIMGAILSYLGIYTVMQVICTTAMIALGYSFTATMQRAQTQVNMSYSSFFKSYMWFAVIFSTITCLAFYFITKYVMSNKLNLE